LTRTEAICTVCGHREFYHQKEDAGCVCGSHLDGVHTLATSDIVFQDDFARRWSRPPVMRPPVAYLKLNNTPNDEMVLANDGTWTGTPAYVEGFDGTANGAAAFDAVIGPITLDNENNFDSDGTLPWTLQIWVKSSDTDTTVIFQKGVVTNPFRCFFSGNALIMTIAAGGGGGITLQSGGPSKRNGVMLPKGA